MRFEIFTLALPIVVPTALQFIVEFNEPVPTTQLTDVPLYDIRPPPVKLYPELFVLLLKNINVILTPPLRVPSAETFA